VRTQDPEGIGMRARQENIQFIHGQAGYFK
jgi:hypothetical protein